MSAVELMVTVPPFARGKNAVGIGGEDGERAGVDVQLTAPSLVKRMPVDARRRRDVCRQIEDVESPERTYAIVQRNAGRQIAGAVDDRSHRPDCTAQLGGGTPCACTGRPP